MIDIHCHILPFIDDGPRDWNESLRMAMIAVNNGIHTIVATPHHGNGRYENPACKIIEQVKILNDKLYEKDIRLTVCPGQEFYLHEGYILDFEQGNLQTLADSSYMLVELPTSCIPAYFYDFVTYMNSKSIHVVIAHPERYSAIIQKPSILAEWIERGITTQITAGSLLGLNGRKMQKIAIEICKLNLANFIASDAHNAVSRGFYLREGYHKLAEIVGVIGVEGYQCRAAQLIEQ